MHGPARAVVEISLLKRGDRPFSEACSPEFRRTIGTVSYIYMRGIRCHRALAR